MVTCSFSKNSKDSIRNRDEWKCIDCNESVAEGTAIASHLDHERKEGYNSPNNGKTRCPMCEMGFHINNHENARQVMGISKGQNSGVIRGWFYSFGLENKVKALRKYQGRIEQHL